VPGPGNYDPKLKVKYLSQGTAVFGKEKRLKGLYATKSIFCLKSFIIVETPGPGTYRVQSDFGYYDVNDSLSANNSFMT
jgi:hypothetical protein